MTAPLLGASTDLSLSSERPLTLAELLSSVADELSLLLEDLHEARGPSVVRRVTLCRLEPEPGASETVRIGVYFEATETEHERAVAESQQSESAPAPQQLEFDFLPGA